jgi:hypothetical protein
MCVLHQALLRGVRRALAAAGVLQRRRSSATDLGGHNMRYEETYATNATLRPLPTIVTICITHIRATISHIVTICTIPKLVEPYQSINDGVPLSQRRFIMCPNPLGIALGLSQLTGIVLAVGAAQAERSSRRPTRTDAHYLQWAPAI